MCEPEDANPEADPNDNAQGDLAEISFHAILGKSVGTNMKLQGVIGNKEVFILVDSGSTHNFVVETIVEELKLPVQFVPSFGVQIGNGDAIRCNRICRNVEVQLPDLKITQNYFHFSIGGVDLVLGIQWLASLNTV